MSLEAHDFKQQLIDRGCIYQGSPEEPLGYHFVGVSQAHLDGYVNLDPIFPHIEYLKSLARPLVSPFISRERTLEQKPVGAVVTPAVGSISLSVVAAQAVMEDGRRAAGAKDVVSVWADKVEAADGRTDFAFTRPGFAESLLEVVRRHESVLVIEDFINRRRSALQVVDAVRQVAGKNAVAGVATIAANSGVSAKILGVPYYTQLCEVSYQTWTPAGCQNDGPCSKQVPIVIDKALGHGAMFREQNADYAGGFVELRAT